MPCPLTPIRSAPICRLPSASRRNNLWTMLLSSSDNRWVDKEAPSGLCAQLNECWLERLPEGTKKIPSTNDFRFLGTFTIDRAFIAYLWILTICYLTLLIITVSRYKIVYNYRSYLILKTSVKKNCVNELSRDTIHIIKQVPKENEVLISKPPANMSDRWNDWMIANLIGPSDV